MHARSVLLLAAVLALSGCTGSGGGLSTYLMHVSETPSGCDYLDYNGEEGRFLREQFNWTGNPGSVDNSIFREEGVQPVDNLVALYECEEGEIASLVLRFASAEHVEQVAGDQTDCGDPEEKWVTSGPVLALVEGDDDVPDMTQALDDWTLRVVAQTGAVDPCAAPSGNQTA